MRDAHGLRNAGEKSTCGVHTPPTHEFIDTFVTLKSYPPLASCNYGIRFTDQSFDHR